MGGTRPRAVTTPSPACQIPRCARDDNTVWDDNTFENDTERGLTQQILPRPVHQPVAREQHRAEACA